MALLSGGKAKIYSYSNERKRFGGMPENSKVRKVIYKHYRPMVFLKG